MPTKIGPNTRIVGDLSGSDAVSIFGKLEGNINTSAPLCIGEEAEVAGDLFASSIEVLGAATGNLEAVEKIQLRASAKVKGDLRAGRVLIADGARFLGKVDMREVEGHDADTQS